MSTSSEETKVATPSAADDYEISFLDLLVVLAENARLLILVPFAVGLLALGIAFLIRPTFTATTKILPPQQQQSTMGMLASQLGTLSSLAGAAGLSLRNPADLYVALARSRTVSDRIIDRFNLMNLYGAKFRADARLFLANVVSVDAGKNGLITIEVDDNDPKRAADIANAYVEELVKLSNDLALTEAKQRRIFFETELRKAHDELKIAQLTLGEAGVGENLIKSSPEAVVGELSRMRALVTAQEIRISSMRSLHTEQSPELQRAQRELASLRAQLAQAERNQPVQGTGRTDYLNRYRDFKYRETLFELMAKQYEAARLDEAREGTVIQVIDTALPPEVKSRPRKARIAVLTTIATGALLVLALFVREYLRRAGNDPTLAGKFARLKQGLRGLVRGRSASG